MPGAASLAPMATRLLECVTTSFRLGLLFVAIGTLQPALAQPPASPATPAPSVVAEEPADPDPDELASAPVEQVALDIVPLTARALERLAERAQRVAERRTRDLVEAQKAALAVGPDTQPESLSAAAKVAREDDQLEKLRLRSEAFARLDLILSEWEEKGGDPDAIASYRAYRHAVIADTIEESSLARLVKVAWTWLIAPTGGLKVIASVAVFFVAFVAVLGFARLMRAAMRRHFEHTHKTSKLAQSFLALAIYWMVVLLGLGLILSRLGLDVTPFLAVFGGLSFIIAFALQETLSNLASGVMILVYRPFDLGERVVTAGIEGRVRKLRMTSTIVATPDNRLVTIPNSKVWNDVIVNASDLPNRRVDLEFIVVSHAAALGLIEEIPGLVARHPDVLESPSVQVHIGGIDGRGAALQVRPWVRSEAYWKAKRSLLQLIMSHLDKHAIQLWRPPLEDLAPGGR